ncbi:hypothetical protein B566_EDAN013274, partial [Ephemera danica]
MNKRLKDRDAFYGGRVICAKLYHKANYEIGERIFYMDFTSLYPTVNKYCKYPIGHPINIRIGNKECEGFEKMNGIIKCKVLPPNDLYHPVLPYRSNGRLVFHLCRSCAEAENNEDCNHNNEERSFIGTYVIDEVVLALTKGYKVIECFEIYEYLVTQYNPKTDEGGLFTEYVNSFLKIKQTASGWPRDNMTEVGKLQYITDYFEHEKVQLNYNEIDYNPILRALAKLLLNSLWGKFGQRSNMTQTTF